MAREHVKNLKEVESAADKVQDAIKGADSAFLDVLTTARSITDELQKSNKYSEQNKEAAREMSAAMESVAAVAQKNTGANRQNLEEMRKQILASDTLDGKQRTLLDNVLKTAAGNAENKAEAEGFAAMISEADNKMKSLGAITGIMAGAFAVLVGLAKAIGAEIDKIGQTFGSVAADDAFQQSFLAAGAEATRLGLGINEVLSVTDTLTSKFGAEFSPEVAKSAGHILDFAMGAGLSNDEATNLIGAMTAVSDLSFEQAAQLGQGVFNLAKQANVAPTAVMKDLAASSEAFSVFSQQSFESLAKGAIQARALGVSIDEVASAAKGMLDFQSSISSELEASVMIGRQLNLQRAREAALAGDSVGFLQEVTRNLGSQDAFLKMNVLQQESFAKALGFSVAQVREMLDNTEKVESLSSRLAQGPGFADLVGDDALSQITEFLNKIKEIGATVLAELAPSFESISEKLLGFIEQMGGAKGIADKIVGVFDMLGGAFTFILNNLGAIIGMMIAFKAASIAIAIAQTTAAIATITGATLGFGTALAIAGILGGAMAVGGYLGSFHDLPEGQMAQGTGPNQLVNINDQEAVAHVKDIEGTTEVVVHNDNSDVVAALEKLKLSVSVDRNQLTFLLNSGAGIG